MRVRLALALAALAGLLLAPAGRAGDALADTGGRPLSFLHVGGPGPQLLDAAGRAVLLRSINVDGLVDYYRPDLVPPYPDDPAAYAGGSCPADDPTVEGVPTCQADFAQMRPLGYNAVRLNVSWSLLEPDPGRIDGTYLDRIAQVVGWARAQGIYVIVDLHQDAWSKYIYTRPGTSCPPGLDATRGFDGAPEWASPQRVPACTAYHTRELDAAVAADAQAFWSDLPAPDGTGLQEHYARVLGALAQRFAGEPAVAGYDLMNEPEPGLAPAAANTTELLPFYAKLAAAVRAAVPGFRQLLLLEPTLERNTTAQRSFATPWSAFSGYPNAVYAPHVYTGVFTAGALTGTPDLATFDSDYGAVAADARALGLPLWVGEFGGPPATDRTILAQHYAQQEARAVGGAMWLWKENANDSVANTFWGVYGPPFGGSTPGGVPQPDRIRRTSRVFPELTAGALQAEFCDPYAGTATVSAISPRVAPGDRSRAALVAVPAVFTGPVVVTGAHAEVVPRSGGREVWLYPDGGPYRLQVLPP